MCFQSSKAFELIFDKIKGLTLNQTTIIRPVQIENTCKSRPSIEGDPNDKICP